MYFSIAVALLTIFTTATAYAGTCSPTGNYLRGNTGTFKVSAMEVRDDIAHAEFQLSTLGNPDSAGVPAVGNMEGELTLTSDGCAGYFSSEQESCALIFIFSNKSVKIHQINHCYFGTGASASGTYDLKK